MPRGMRGMTLIELMTVIVIVAVLGSIAVSSYRNYLMRTNRTEARMSLLRVQSAQEKFFLQNNRYADDDELETPPPAGLGVNATTQSGYYTIAIENVNAAGTTYTAVANAAGGQLQDAAACQRFTIDHTGVRTPNNASGCWR